jgi:membrane-associated phospholipid phosphatase
MTNSQEKLSPDSDSDRDAVPPSEPKPNVEPGPLGKLDPVNPVVPGAAPHPPSGLATMTVVVGFGGLVGSLVVLGSVAEGVRSQEVFALDAWATPFLHGIASPQLDALMNGLTDLGTSLIIIPILVVAVGALVWKRRFGLAVFLGVAIGGSVILQGTMKVFFARPRPQLAWATVLPDGSFPSGHTMNSVIFYGALALILWSIWGRRIGLIALGTAALLAFGVGVSRIYLGYHYFTDVVGGILAGIAWLIVVGAAFRARPTWRTWRTRSVGRSDHSGGASSRVVEG